MAVNSIHPLPHGGILPNGPVPPAPPVTPAQRVSGQVVTRHHADERQQQTATFKNEAAFMQLANPHARSTAQTPAARTPLSQRRSRSAERKATPQERGADPSRDEDAQNMASAPLPAAISLAMELAQQDRREQPQSSLDEELRARGLGIEQRRKALRGALERAVEDGSPQTVTARLRSALDGLERRLAKEEVHKFRGAMHDPSDLDARIDQIRGINGKRAEPTRRELRVLGPRPNVEKDRVDVPLRAQSVHKFVQKIAKPGEYLSTLLSCWKQCIGSLPEKASARSITPEMMRVRQDSRVFLLVQSAHALAEEMRGYYASAVKRPPALSSEDCTALLLAAAEQGWGKGRADSMVKSMVGNDELDDTRLARVYLLMWDVLARLPVPPGINAESRYGLMVEMRERAYRLGNTLPANGSTREEKLEQRLVGGLTGSGAGAPDRRHGNG